MDKITSAKNPMVRRMKDLKNSKTRRETGLFMVEGEVMLREALKCGLVMHELLADEAHESIAEELGGRGAVVPRDILESVCETRTPQGVCASFEQPHALAAEELPDRIVALDGVQDPGNVGTIWRTADAAGFHALIAGTGTADLLSPKVQRASMGSGFRVPFSLSDDLASTLTQLTQRGYHVIASDLHGDDFYARPDEGKKFVLIIGNEAKGISERVKAVADMRVRLPMRGGAESLNAAVAAGIMMYEIMRCKD